MVSHLIGDIYDAALSGEFAVASKFAPTYGMVLSLLRTRTAAEAEALLDKSFGQFQSARQLEHWAHRRANLEEQLVDLKRRRFRHPRVPCTERTLTQREKPDVSVLLPLAGTRVRGRRTCGRGPRGGLVHKEVTGNGFGGGAHMDIYPQDLHTPLYAQVLRSRLRGRDWRRGLIQ